MTKPSSKESSPKKPISKSKCKAKRSTKPISKSNYKAKRRTNHGTPEQDLKSPQAKEPSPKKPEVKKYRTVKINTDKVAKCEINAPVYKQDEEDVPKPKSIEEKLPSIKQQPKEKIIDKAAAPVPNIFVINYKGSGSKNETRDTVLASEGAPSIGAFIAAAQNEKPEDKLEQKPDVVKVAATDQARQTGFNKEDGQGPVLASSVPASLPNADKDASPILASSVPASLPNADKDASPIFASLPNAANSTGNASKDASPVLAASTPEKATSIYMADGKAGSTYVAAASGGSIPAVNQTTNQAMNQSPSSGKNGESQFMMTDTKGGAPRSAYFK